jgi:hypothetical protein
MTDSNEFLFKEWSESAKKFDYFVAGFLGAVSSYFIQNLTAFSFGWNADSIQFAGVVCLLLALFAALICIERHVTVARVTYDLYTKQKYLDSLAVRRPPQPVLDPDTGRQYSEEEIVRMLETSRSSVAEGKKGREKLFKQAARAYDWRNRLLIAGLSVIVISKFLHL